MAIPNIHFVGSIGLPDVESTFRLIGNTVGDRAKRYPDGEPGKRHYWVMWQGEVFQNHQAFTYDSQRAGLTDTANSSPRYRLKENFDVESLTFESIGYAAEAIESYSVFRRLREEGVIPERTRMQVSLPTPVAVLMAFVTHEEISAVEPAFAEVMQRELASILSNIPHQDLAIQWDVAHEVVAFEGAYPLPYQDALSGTCQRVARLVDQIHNEVEVGIHLCYGDPGHKHIIEPNDLGNCVKFANLMQTSSAREIDFFHMPVLRSRSDEPYFDPLRNLRIGSAELVLGLVHYTDGVDGARSRMKAANKVVTDYSIATECGFGRRDPQTIPGLLEIHADLVREHE